MKKFIKNLFGNLFNRENRNVASSVSNATTSVQTEEDEKNNDRECFLNYRRYQDDEKNNDRNTLLQKIYWAIGDYKCGKLESYVREYLTTYGSLTGEETVWFWERFGDIYDGYYDWSNQKLLFMATDFTKKFFFALINGEEAAAKEYRHKAELQKELIDAFENRDVITFDKLLSEGADINYAYYSPYGDHKTSIWEKAPWSGKEMYAYIKTRTDIPELNKIRAERELIASRKVN